MYFVILYLKKKIRNEKNLRINKEEREEERRKEGKP